MFYPGDIIVPRQAEAIIEGKPRYRSVWGFDEAEFLGFKDADGKNLPGLENAYYAAIRTEHVYQGITIRHITPSWVTEEFFQLRSDFERDVVWARKGLIELRRRWDELQAG